MTWMGVLFHYLVFLQLCLLDLFLFFFFFSESLARAISFDARHVLSLSESLEVLSRKVCFYSE